MNSNVNNNILDTLNSAILCLDSNSNISYLNATAEALFETGAGKLIGRQFSSQLSAIEESSILVNLDKHWRTQTALTEREASITLANGLSILVDYSISPVSDFPSDNQSDIAVLIEIHRLGHQRQFDRDSLIQLQQQASQQLTRGLAHEINNPLGGIRGAAQLMEKQFDHPDLLEYAEIIISEVDRLQALLHNLHSPIPKMELKAMNILEILEHIRQLILAAEPERIKMHRDYDPSIPEFFADKNMLIQALLNIARNAVEAIDGKGQITVKTRVGHRVTIGQQTHPLVLIIDISDDGRGISMDLSETIFLPMITDKADGSGLGLSITQDIISRHGGSIGFSSSSSGTTFSITLPLLQRL